MRGVLAVFAASFAAILAGAYPSIAPRDSADLAAAGLTLGVAHPPGYPLFALLGHAWLSAVPWGNPAYRLNALSALAGAAAVAALFAWARRRAGVAGGLLAAFLWLSSAPLWKFSGLAESYSLQALFAAVLLLLTDGPRESVFRRARLSGLTLGLGLVNHQTLLFFVPGLLWLWRDEARRCGAGAGRLAVSAAGPLAAGLSLYAYLWIRLGALGPALETILRTRYGSGTLFQGLAGPLTPESAGTLAFYAVRELARAVTWPGAAAALAGAAVAWRGGRSRAAGLLAAGAGGALFVVLSRFDPSSWVAREVLEPAFVLPSLVACAFAGECLSATPRPAAVAAVLAAAAAIFHAPLPEHRDDFLAHDYARDLRRAVPPGGSLLLAGDTTSFGLRWLSLTAPREPARDAADAPLVDPRAWLAARAGRPEVFTTGLGLADLRSLGLPSPGRGLAPEGLVQRVGARPPVPIAPSVLRRPRGWSRDDSYVRNVKFSYAYAAWLSARLLEAQGVEPPETLDLTAVVLDPVDYRLR